MSRGFHPQKGNPSYCADCCCHILSCNCDMTGVSDEPDGTVMHRLEAEQAEAGCEANPQPGGYKFSPRRMAEHNREQQARGMEAFRDWSWSRNGDWSWDDAEAFIAAHRKGTEGEGDAMDPTKGDALKDGVKPDAPPAPSPDVCMWTFIGPKWKGACGTENSMCLVGSLCSCGKTIHTEGGAFTPIIYWCIGS